MRSTLRALLAVAVCSTFLAPQGLSQERHSRLREVPRNERDGFWIGFGLGGGTEQFELDNDPAGYSQEITRPTFYLKLGGTPSQSFLIGGELFAWVNDAAGVTETLSSAMFIAQWYPARQGAFFLKGGVGITDNSFEFDDGFRSSKTGFGGVVGLGYDIRVGRKISIAPTVDFIGHKYDGFEERMVNFGLGLVFH